MGQFMGRITSVVTGKAEKWRLTGMKCDCTAEDVSRFRRWWKLMNLEHGLIFWLAGLITILLISLLAYSTTYGRELGAVQGGNFVIAEADVIGQKLTPVVGIVFLLVVGL